jgi:hypothetical protein
MVRLILVNGSYQKIDGSEFISIFTDLGSSPPPPPQKKKKKKKKLKEFLILEC